MIKKIFNGYEHYECSKCGEETQKGEDYCEICGHSFSQPINVPQYQNIEKEEINKTVCIVISAQPSGIFMFTELKVDMTPKHLLHLPQFQNQRMFKEPHNEFYVFKRDKQHIYVNQVLNLDMNEFEHFSKPNFVKVFFNKKGFLLKIYLVI